MRWIACVVLFVAVLCVSCQLLFTESAEDCREERLRVISQRICDGDYVFSVLPPTLKIHRLGVPPTASNESLLEMHVARGEAESLQFLISNGATAISQAVYSATPFVDDAGHEIAPEISVVGYVPVDKPTRKPYGFGIKGEFPDVVMPNKPFDVAPYSNQSLWLSVWVPEDAVPGIYRSQVTISVPGMSETKREVSLRVYPVTIPKFGKLKTCWVYQPTNVENLYKGDYDEFTRLNLKYRFSMDKLVSSDCLPWNRVFTVDEAGKVTADWTEFDQRMEYWRALGKNTFSMYSPRWFEYEAVEKQINVPLERQKYALIAEHLREKGWSEDFYLYVFDEPFIFSVSAAKKIGKFFQEAMGHDAHLILTANLPNMSSYIGCINIFCPHIDHYKPSFMAKRQAAGDHAWMYTCIGAVHTTYPDTWRLDYYGTGHRAVGWWLFKYNAEGYLYWGVNFWRVNPWKDSMTYPRGNGDGSMFYPDPEGKSVPWPSIRTEIVRDGFEDYELLTLLREKYAPGANSEADKVLSCEGIIQDTKHYNQLGDTDYIDAHRRILELLSAE